MRSRRAIAILTVITLTLAATPAATLAQSLDATSAEALATTLRLLQDPTARSAAITSDPQASAVDAQLQALAGSVNMQELYALAAVIFSELAANSGGDAGE
jgi:FlaG/FlaF family flagellin (archaellin)